MFSDFIQALKYFWINFFWVEPGVQASCQIFLLHWFFSWTSRTLTLWCEQLRPVDFVHVSAVGLKVGFIQWLASPQSPRKPSRVTDEPTTIPPLWNLTRAALPLPWRSSETRVGKIYASTVSIQRRTAGNQSPAGGVSILLFFFVFFLADLGGGTSKTKKAHLSASNSPVQEAEKSQTQQIFL